VNDFKPVMKKKLLLLCLCSTFFCNAQKFTKPNYSKIKLAVQSKSSPLNYAKLKAKFEKADSSMTLKERRHLYYGFIYQDKYDPYLSSTYMDSLRKVLKIKSPAEAEFKQIVKFSDSILVDNPFNINAYNYKSYASSHLKDKKTEMAVFHQKKIIYDALLSSGNGLTKASAYYIIIPSHEHIILKLKGLKFGGSQSSIDQYEYLSVNENDDNIDGLFFELSASKNHMKNLFNK